MTVVRQIIGVASAVAIIVAAGEVLLGSGKAVADEPAAVPFAEPKKDWEWDQDKRFDFLMERLASLEASLEAVDAAIAKASGKRGAKIGEARRAEANNEMMDRKGGGPMKWNEFYGTTAEKFFYHPVDPNTTYHTNTALQQMGNYQDDKVGSGVPASQSLPVHQRPPQFDYIYRANRDAKDRAEKEALAMAGKIEELSRRKFELEKEQAELWCLLAFRAIQRMNIPRKPLLRFQLVAATTDPRDMQRTEALAAAARFLAISLLIVEKAEEDQATAFGQIKEIVTNARNDFDDALLNLDAVADDASDKKAPLGKYVALAQLLDDTSSNLSESFEVATEGDEAKDLARKDRFRGLLQRSLVEYAQIVLALDEICGAMKTDWIVKVDTRNKVVDATVGWGPPRAPVARSVKAGSSAASSSKSPEPQKRQIPKEAVAFRNKRYLFSKERVTLAEARNRVRGTGGQLVVIDSPEENEFVQQNLGGEIAWLGLVRVNGGWVTPNNQPPVYFNWYPGQPSNFQGEDGAAIWPNGRWHDHLTHQEQYRYVIEW